MPIHDLDQLMQETLAAWQIPGGAVAIVQNGEAWAQGYGVLAAGQPEPVGAETVFAIGSTTKAFTSAAVGMLVEAGRLRWDDPVVAHLPDFALADPWVTARVTVRDLLCHRLGLERAQRLYYHQGYDQRELMRRMRYLRSVAEFRTEFCYANQQYGVAGLLVEAVSGRSWDEFVRERIFQPLGMERSRTGYEHLGDLPNVAQPHAVLDEKYPASVRFLGDAQPVPWFQLSREPAGSILTSAHDLTRWLRALLAGGQPLVQPATLAEMTAPQMIMHDLENSDLAPLYYLQPGTHFWTYGLGWWVMDYRGEKVVMHGGQMPGFNSVVAFFPERQVGLAVLLNVHQTLAHAALFYALSDRLLAGPGRNWNGQFRQVAQGYMEQVKAAADQQPAARRADASATLTPEQLAGTYESALYGEVTITAQAGRLALHYGQSQADLELWDANTYRGRWAQRGLLEDARVEFDATAQTLTLHNDHAQYHRRTA